MAKNKKTIKPSSPTLPAPSAEFSVLGKKLLVAGAGLVLLGFVVLSRADPLGRNAAAVASPFLLLSGYAAIGLGLFLPPDPPAPPQPPTV